MLWFRFGVRVLYFLRDTPAHTLVDDAQVGLEGMDAAFNGQGPQIETEDGQIWPGKGQNVAYTLQ